MANNAGALAEGVMVNTWTVPGKVAAVAQPDTDDEVEGCLSVPGQSVPLKRADCTRSWASTVTGQPDFRTSRVTLGLP